MLANQSSMRPCILCETHGIDNELAWMCISKSNFRMQAAEISEVNSLDIVQEQSKHQWTKVFKLLISKAYRRFLPLPFGPLRVGLEIRCPLPKLHRSPGQFLGSLHTAAFQMHRDADMPRIGLGLYPQNCFTKMLHLLSINNLLIEVAVLRQKGFKKSKIMFKV